MKRVFFLLAVLTQLVSLSACSEEELVPNVEPGGETSGGTYVIPGTPITIEADVDQGNTRTALGADGRTVLWSQGDAFSLVTAAQKSENWDLVANVTAINQALGVNVLSSSNYYLKYTGIKVLYGSEDITSKIVSASPSSSDANNTTYRVGIYNSAGKYQLPPANTSVKAYTYSTGNKYYIPLVQSSSTSKVLPLTVCLNGVQYSSNGSKWTDVSSYQNGGFNNKSTLTYGKNTTVSYETNSKFTGSVNEAGGVSSTASFSGTISQTGGPYYAVYPYSEDNKLEDGSLCFNLPAKQTYVANSFGANANPAVGLLEQEDGDNHISFKNVCGVLKLQLKGNDRVTGIEVTDLAGNALNGAATVKAADVTVGAAPYATVTGGTSTEVLEFDAPVQLNSTAETSFYIVLPVGALSGGMTVTINTLYGAKTITTTRANTITQNVVKAMPAIDISTLECVVPEFDIENPTLEPKQNLQTIDKQ